MKEKWSEMTKGAKTLTVFSIIAGVVAIFFAIADLANWMKSAEAWWKVSFAAMMAFDGVKNIKSNRKLAIIDIVIAAALLVLGIVQFIA